MNALRPENSVELPQNVVHLWHCRFNTQMAFLKSYESLLSDNEIERAARFKFDIHRNKYIIARGVLRSLLGRYLNERPCDVQFGYTNYDKPFLKETPFAVGRDDLRFNISHSGNWAVFGFVQEMEIGVDIEKIKNDFEVMDIAQNFFSSDEIKTLQALPEKDRVAGFYRCWTRKEAFIKAKGSGLSFSLTSFSVSLNLNSARLLRTDWDAAEKTQWQLFTFSPELGYQGALTVRGAVSDFRQIEYEGV